MWHHRSLLAYCHRLIAYRLDRQPLITGFMMAKRVYMLQECPSQIWLTQWGWCSWYLKAVDPKITVVEVFWFLPLRYNGHPEHPDLIVSWSMPNTFHALCSSTTNTLGFFLMSKPISNCESEKHDFVLADLCLNQEPRMSHVNVFMMSTSSLSECRKPD